MVKNYRVMKMTFKEKRILLTVFLSKWMGLVVLNSQKVFVLKMFKNGFF